MEQPFAELIAQFGVYGALILSVFLWITKSLIPGLQADAKEARTTFVETLKRVEDGCVEVQKQAILVIQENTRVFSRVEKALDLVSKEGGDPHGQ